MEESFLRCNRSISKISQHGLMIATVFNLCFKLEFGSRAKEKAASELTEEEKNVKALKRYKCDA